MEKVDVVKRLIRSHNYKDTERVYARCGELGISVNKNALYRFSEKLKQIDNAKRQSPTWQILNGPAVTDLATYQAQNQAYATSNSDFDNDAELLSDFSDIEKPVDNLGARMSRSDAKQRETEITFELGALKIKEHALLEELNELAKIFDASH